MQVSEDEVAAIVLALLAELDMRSGSRVESAQLVREWHNVGLRRDDLDRGLALLLRDGLLVEDELIDQRPGYVLTRTGFQGLERASSPLQLGLARYQRLRRKAARRRNAQPVTPDAKPPVERRRRRND